MGRVTVVASSPTLRMAIGALLGGDDDMVFLDQDCPTTGGSDLHVEIFERFRPDRAAAAEARLASVDAAVIVLDVHDPLGEAWAGSLSVGAVLGLDAAPERLGAACAAVRAGLRLRHDRSPTDPQWLALLTAHQRRWLERRLDRGCTISQLAAAEHVASTTMKNRLRTLRRLMGAATLDEAARLYRPWRDRPAATR